ncbi:succinyl-diaminopimelate desuccinylase [Allosphingosinicella sp.]|uniref:succinyl-diaminopimelate desuccinylase n=1 Tax=Allosphingosinicella sp. TaxID=2823234 RepID=UPI002FC20E9B
MTTAIDPVDVAARLIACPSVTPKEAGALTILGEALQDLGFEVHRFLSGSAPDGPVENLFASRGRGSPHFAFAGHIDVVPAGNGWSSDAFTPEIRGDLLYGRGAVDMKGAIAAFVAACAEVSHHAGTLSFIITGDEEGPAVFGTAAIMEWMAERSIRPDMILIGEPTSEHRLGDTVKIGRRGSVNIWIDVKGTQGHVAYPHLADNPIARLARILAALEAMPLDEGTEWFQPSNLEVTDLKVDNPACNVIPGDAHARLNIRFNDRQRGPELVERVRGIVEDHAPGARFEARISGEAFLNEPGPLSEIVTDAIQAETGLTPALSTSGGTSDARFLTKLCPVIEFGLPNATMHKLDEAVAVQDLGTLQAIYGRVIRSALGRD